MKFLSLCSGIEAASVAFGPLGWKAVGFAEIEAFPSAVLAHHYPDVPNLGDMTQFAQWPEEIFLNADVIVGGPPCQAFSVAGQRQSLQDDRGNLTLTYVELLNHADRIRLRGGEQPAIFLYENVPGILSTSDNAFGCFLGALSGADSPIVPPPAVGWTDAGVVAGPQRTAAWRTLDAQFFRLAQRRRRVFVVGSARAGFDPAKVLFEWEGVRRDLAPSRETRQGFAASADGGADGRGVAGTLSAGTGGGGGLGTDFELGGGLLSADVAGPLLSTDGHHAVRRDADNLVPEVAGSLDTECGGGKMTHQTVQNGHLIGTITARMFNALGPRDVEEGALLPVVGTLPARMGRNGGSSNSDVVSGFIMPTTMYLDPLNQSAGEDVAKTLAARSDMDGAGVVAVGTDMYNGRVTGDVAATLSSQSGDGVSAGSSVLVPAMVFKPSHFTRDKDGAPSDLCPPLSADADKGDQDPLVLAPTIFTGDGVVADPVSASEGKTYTHEGANFRLHNCVGVQPYSIMPMNSGKDFKARPTDVAQPLMAGGPVGGNQGGDIIVQVEPLPAYRCQSCGEQFTDQHGAGVGGLAPVECPKCGEEERIAMERDAKVLRMFHGTEPLPFDTTQVTSGANFSNPKPGDACHPLAAGAHAPAIAFQERGRADGRNLEHQVDLAYALTAPSDGGRAGERCIAFSAKDHGGDATEDMSPTLRAGGHTGSHANAGVMPAIAHVAIQHTAMQVRRLTPRECERLQGFEDDYTQIPWRGKPAAECPDGPRYKALGNSWAVPCARWIGQRITLEMEKAA